MDGEARGSAQAPGAPTLVVPADGLRRFRHVLANTLVANVTTSFLWFALTFWIYIQTGSVLATGVVGGAYMLLVAVFAMLFGTIVDRHRKHRVMVLSSVVTLACFAAGAAVFVIVPTAVLLDPGAPWLWLFAGVVLVGAVVENMRNIALSTTVTLLVPEERRARANGLVGTVQGIAFVVTSVFSGLSIGFLGMGWTLAIAIGATAVALAHLAVVRIPEAQPEPSEGGARTPAVDLRGAIVSVRAVQGLFALIVFSTFNNLIGGVYIALMDPYGLELLSVQSWGIVLGVAATGFIVGGLVIARLGLGQNPIRTMLLVVVAMGILGAVFTIREWWVLYAVGIWVYMALVPAVEAAEQTVIQRVVPFRRQGRVFGFAQAFEAAAAPVTAFLIAPLAELWIIPTMAGPSGRATWGWLVGPGTATTRGIAVVFAVAGLVMVGIALAAFLTRSYRILSARYVEAPDASGSRAEGEVGIDAPGVAASDANVGADAGAARAGGAPHEPDALPPER